MLKRSFDFNMISSFTIGNNISLSSLDRFRRKLEKEYFAEVNLALIGSDDQRCDLVVEFQSNFSLVEFLNKVQSRNIVLVNRNCHEEFQDLAFSSALSQLRAENMRPIGLEELNFSLSDCEITIKMIYPNSIEDQLGNIYKMLESHYINFTHSKSIQPSEIFIPVFEEDLEENLREGISVRDNVSSQRDYFNFWGFYYSHNDDAVIYDLSSRSIISGDLQILGE